MARIQVGMRELRNKLSEYLRRVKAGQVITVTNRGKAIGQVVPVKANTQERLQAVMDAGIAEGTGGSRNRINRRPLIVQPICYRI